jgi:hypothetical protein
VKDSVFLDFTAVLRHTASQFLNKNLDSQEPFFIFTTCELKCLDLLANASIKALISDNRKPNKKKQVPLTLDELTTKREVSDKTGKLSGGSGNAEARSAEVMTVGGSFQTVVPETEKARSEGGETATRSDQLEA